MAAMVSLRALDAPAFYAPAFAARLAIALVVATGGGCKSRVGAASSDAAPDDAGAASATGPSATSPSGTPSSAMVPDAGWTPDQKLALARLPGTTAADQRVFDMQLAVE